VCREGSKSCTGGVRWEMATWNGWWVWCGEGVGIVQSLKESSAYSEEIG